MSTSRKMITAPRSERSERSALCTETPVSRLNLPAITPVSDNELYGIVVAYGGAIVAAERGEETELVRPDGRVAARIVPA
jgi:hypothetical protein